MEDRWVVCGFININIFQLIFSSENHCKKAITSLVTSRYQVLDYRIEDYQKHKELVLERKILTTNIQPGTTLSVDCGLRLPSAIPATTPIVYIRKINIRYNIAIDITTGNRNHPVMVIEKSILVSNLPFIT